MLNRPLPTEVVESYAHCREVTRCAAGNFYRGIRLTPEPKRSSIFAIYAWMRAIDDLADGACAAPMDHQPQRLESIEHFASATDAAIDTQQPLPTDGRLWAALRDTVTRYRIPSAYLHTMLDGQRRDAQPAATIKTFDELYSYCYRVASVVGLICMKVWGDDGDSSVAKLVEYRGVALQLTNILRDLAEDAQCGRVYLPVDDLTRFGVKPQQLQSGRGDEAFRRLMQFQIERARSYYEMSATLERHITPDCRATSWAIMRTYRVLLERIADRPERVLRQRVDLSVAAKLTVIGRAVIKRQWRSY